MCPKEKKAMSYLQNAFNKMKRNLAKNVFSLIMKKNEMSLKFEIAFLE